MHTRYLNVLLLGKQMTFISIHSISSITEHRVIFAMSTALGLVAVKK